MINNFIIPFKRRISKTIIQISSELALGTNSFLEKLIHWKSMFLSELIKTLNKFLTQGFQVIDGPKSKIFASEINKNQYKTNTKNLDLNCVYF